jgi:hypothetical protein
MPRGKHSAFKVQKMEQEQKAFELRMAGATYEQIGKALGMTSVGAFQIIRRGSIKRRTATNEVVEQIRELELERLDAMQRTVWPKALKGDLLALDRVLTLMNTRAKYLGLHAPERKELSGPGGRPLQTTSANVTIDPRNLTDEQLLVICEAAGINPSNPAPPAIEAGPDSGTVSPES